MDLYLLLNSPTKLFDSHCHLDSLDEDILINTIEESKNLEKIISVSVNFNSIQKNLDILNKFPQKVKVYAGVDPEIYIHGSILFNNFSILPEIIGENLNNIVVKNIEKITGIGETGLDFYWLATNKSISQQEMNKSKKFQVELFEIQIALAKNLKLPLSIHSRGAEKDVFKILKKSGAKGIFHSYTGDFQTAKKILDNGFGLGINGIITFPKAAELRDTYKKLLKGKNLNVPEDFFKNGIFFETDSPFLSPQEKRGKINTPANTEIIFKEFLKIIS